MSVRFRGSRGVLATCVALTLFAPPALPASSAAPQQPPQPEVASGAFDFLLGTWKVEGRSKLSDRRWHPLNEELVARRTAGGHHAGLRQVWRSETDGGSKEGTLLFLHDAAADEWAVLGFGLDERNYFSAPFRVRLGEASLELLEVAQLDSTGPHRQRARFSEVSEFEWSFRLDRSYDGGASWIPIQELRAERQDGEPDPAPGPAPADPGRVTTLFEGFGGSRALAVGDEGQVYLAARENSNQDPPILRVAPDGERSVFASGLKPAGLSWWKGWLYVHAHDVEGGRVVRIDRRGKVEELGRAPGDSLAVDDEGNAYVMDGPRVLRLTPDGEVALWAESPAIDGALASAFDGATGTFYAGVWSSGGVWALTAGGEARQVGGTEDMGGGSIAWMEWSGGELWLTCFGANQIWRLVPGGEARRVAGCGFPGHLDGPTGEAHFLDPNGIAVDRERGRVYVAELLPGPTGPWERGRLRRIDLER